MSAEGVEKQALPIKMCLACSKEFQGEMAACPDDGTALIQLSRTDPCLGQLIADRYAVKEIIGKGGMGIVYLAHHQMMDRWVALKMLQAELTQDEISVKRFQQEAKAASHLSHPHVITLHDFGIMATGQPYLVMEFLEGTPLLDVLRSQGPLEPKRAVKIFTEAADGLNHAHKQGIVHRDLKPSNIILVNHQGDPDFVKIVDFGLAKLMPWSGKESQHLTKTGEVFGSPIYMSPEQCMGKPLGPTSDIYSLGITLFEALTGKPPFRGTNSIQTASKHMTESPPHFYDVRPDLVLPEGLEKVVLKCLEKQPEMRFQDMAEFKDALIAGLNTEAKMEMPSSLMVSTRAIPAITNNQAVSAMQQAQSAKRPAIDMSSRNNSLQSRLIQSEPAKSPVNPAIIAAAVVGLLGVGGAAYAFLVPQQTTTTGTVYYYDMGDTNSIRIVEPNGTRKTLKLGNFNPNWGDDVDNNKLGMIIEAQVESPMMADKSSAVLTGLVGGEKANSAMRTGVETVTRFLNLVVDRNDRAMDFLSDPNQFMSLKRSMLKEPYKRLARLTAIPGDNGDENITERPVQAYKILSGNENEVIMLVDGAYFSAADNPGFWQFTIDPKTKTGAADGKITSINSVTEAEWEKL